MLDRQLFALGTNVRTGQACAGLNFTSAPQIECDTASCIVVAFFRECLEGRPE